jgi:ferritin-like metal-binding protein YciE
MEKMINLRDLLVHEVQDLYSAEEQIIEALPMMIEKAGNTQLKKALQEHLKVTEQQKKRLDEVKHLLLSESENAEQDGKSKGLFSGLFGGGKQKCKGIEGLIEEGQKVMGEDMTPEVLDAAIIACAQKIEHYEICGYGTARAYAIELNLRDVAEMLEETLDEEYEADDLLTDLAVSRLNEQAQNATDDEEEGEGSESRGSRSKSASGGNRSNGSNSSNGNGAAGRSTGKSKSASSGKSSSSSSSASSSRGKNNGSTRSKSASSSSRGSSGGSKSGAKKSSGGSRSKSSAGKSKSSR